MLYIAYLDEFGHEGAYISRDDPRFNTSPVFGLGGFILPYKYVRQFSMWFFRLKCNLLRYEIECSGREPYRWEKKGSQLYTPTNIRKYRQLRNATNRYINKIRSLKGHLFYVGTSKWLPPEKADAFSLNAAVLREAIKRLNQYSARKEAVFMMILDEKSSEFRRRTIIHASREMYGENKRHRLIEPPIQAESHRYQTLQCADWLCGLYNRLCCYEFDPDQYNDYEIAARFFKQRVKSASTNSSLRHKKISVGKHP